MAAILHIGSIGSSLDLIGTIDTRTGVYTLSVQQGTYRPPAQDYSSR